MITLADVEALAQEVERSENARREKLLRLIAAYARILAIREPERFPRKPTMRADEDGHWDNSYPPKIELKAEVGPRLLLVRSWDYEDNATESGSYYAWRRITTDHGLYVARDGSLYGATETGTGRFVQFAARPGDCDVSCEIEWSELDTDDVPTSDLVDAEQTLRALAFPASAAAER